MKIKKILIPLFLYFISASIIADSGIYICGHFRRDRTKTVTVLKASGFTFGILFNVHVETDGTLTTDGEVICKDGKYVFDQKIAGYPSDIAQVNYVDDVVSLLSGRTSMQRLEHCIGGWTNYSYKNITNLVNTRGTGTTSILYKNFKALKDAIPEVIAINNDIEHEYESVTQAQFHIMLYDIGFKTTIAPYTNKSYWDNFVARVEAARPGAVDRNYLQIYGGGGGNNPANWKIGNLPIYGSRDIEANPNLAHQDIVNIMTSWKNSAGIGGGFYWNYNYDRDLVRFSKPINEIFGGGEVKDRSRIVAMVYPVKDYKAPQTNFILGSYTKSQILANGFDVSKLSSVKLNENVKMILFTEDNFRGDSIIVDSNSNDLALILGIKKINSWRIHAKSIENISGKDFVIVNKQSRFALKPSRNNTNMTIFQMAPDTTQFSIWQFEQNENGLYKIVNKGSGRVLQLINNAQSAYLHEGLNIVQNIYTGGSDQQFIVKQNEDNTFKLIPLSSLKYVGMTDNLQFSANAMPVQRVSSAAPSTDWELVNPKEIVNRVNLTFGGLLKVYPRIARNELTIELPHHEFSLKISDLSGHFSIEKKIDNGRLDISNLSGGVYILNIKAGNQSENVKILKI